MAKKPRKVDDINVPDAILSKDPIQRLNALVRRHGGKALKEGGGGAQGRPAAYRQVGRGRRATDARRRTTRAAAMTALVAANFGLVDGQVTNP